MRHFTVLLLILSACGVSPASAQIGGPYSISGTVTNERGEPVKGARVEALKMVGAFLEGCPDLIPNIPHSKTDDAGHFLIDVSLCVVAANTPSMQARKKRVVPTWLPNFTAT
jgi:hypothetical protein